LSDEKGGAPMFDRFENSWRLVKASAAVLRADKELVVFPIVSGAASLLVTASFVFPMLGSDVFDRLTSGGLQPSDYVLLFAFYLVQYFIVNFANAALVGAAMIRLRGGDPTLEDGFRIAASRVGVILGYSLIGATVGMILRAIQGRGGIVGQIAAGLVGIAWNLVTFLVVPVLVVENVGPIEAIQRSGALLKRTWGQQIVGNFGIGLAMFVIALGALVVCLPVILLAVATGSIVVIVVAIALAAIVLTAVALVGSALQGIFTAALYRYAADGETDGYFAPDMVRGAFVPKGA
jgi:hypothetical protein